VLSKTDCDLILDVGGNRGQFSLICQLVKPTVHILAFEPLPNEANVFRQVHAGNAAIQLNQVALGEMAGEAEIHVSQRADSSSLLPIGGKQTDLFPESKEVGTLKIPVKRLDDFQSDWEKYSRILLKIDVQGFELSVLRGATEALTHCAYVYVECSETELYVGQALYPEVESFLKTQGFELKKRLNEQIVDGQLVQSDCLFGRVDSLRR
jgi:FkbM family methyltransferase